MLSSFRAFSPVPTVAVTPVRLRSGVDPDTINESDSAS